MQQLSPEHLAAVVILALLIAVAVVRPRAISPRVLAVVIGASFVIDELINAVEGTPGWDSNLPLQLSDIVAILAPIALWTRRPVLVEILYFLALAATVHAVLTPGALNAFPHPQAFTYFAVHSGPVLAACLLVFGLRDPIRPGAVWRAFAAILAMAAVAGAANVVTGGNYMFLREKPVTASLMDVLGPWPLYIVTAAAIVLALFYLLAAFARLVGDPAGEPSPVMDVPHHP